jgi:uncharacterized membrane protein
MAYVERSIVVEKPVRTVYNQWTQFEEFPRFMQGIEEVRQLDDRRLYWRARLAGKAEEWEAEIVEQIPDSRIRWRGLAGLPNGGLVRFEKVGGDRCKVTLQMEYDPQGFAEKAMDALGFVSRRLEGDLERFKKFIEERGLETGEWRGTIDPQHSGHP